MAGLNQVNVQFRGGTYFLPATVMFSAADSGTAATPIVYQNYPGESPVFSGGVRVQNWTNTSGNVWKTTLPASTQYFENLFYNGVRRLRPRLGGYVGAYYRIAATVYLNSPAPPAAAPDPNCSVYVPGSGWECFDRFQYSPADPIAGTWKNLAPIAGNPCGKTAGNQAIAGDIEVLDFEQFSTSKLRVSCVDTANHIVYITGPTEISQANYTEEGFIAGNRYLVDNVQDALTLGGQWFLDRSTTPWTLTYLANAGENPNTDTTIVPQLPQVLVATGLQYVTFQGLTFEHDNYTLPPAGHASAELEQDIGAAVSFQNSQHITFDSSTVTQTSGTGLEVIPCINGSSPAYCVATSLNAVVTGNVIENSAFYDIAVLGIRIGNPFQMADTDANVPQLTTVRNNVVEGYGRIVPAAFGIGQGMGHDNLYTHNDVYDGYHCAISTSQSIAETTTPSGIGNASNVISFNHVYNLLQGIMNDGGSIRIDGGNSVFTAAGNKILNNKIHDVTDASIMNANGYGGHGIYMDDNTGLVDVENNLVFRVSGAGVYTPHGPAAPNQANIVKNNILAYGRLAMVSIGDPYGNGVPSAIPQEFVITSNLMYFNRNNSSVPKFFVEDGCTYSGGFPFVQFVQYKSNLYWRTDGAFVSDSKAFHVQPEPGSGPEAPCTGNLNDDTFYTFPAWQQTVGEDAQSAVQNPGFANPAYPADDYSLPNGSPGFGFVVFDPSQAGRSNPVIHPPAVPAKFPTKLFNPATDY
ncbi:MAG: right-handed parallel beta-helix repeat-containing protein [Candidatus Sulfopaludibacter sp.]|nr:right-handed parallel beta-helix repeat-containing protein [Candidatus Sulfopaludibacter sp.]